MQFLYNWLHKRAMQKLERQNQLQLTILNGQQLTTNLQVGIKKQSLEIAKMSAELQHSIKANDAEIQIQQIQIKKQWEDLEQAKDLRLDELILKKQELEYTHVLNMADLELRKEKQQMERLQIEAERVQKAFTEIMQHNSLMDDKKQQDRIKETEMLYKQFEMELSYIRLLNSETQAAEFEKLRAKTQERLNSYFGNEKANSVNGTY
jgi:hypothetical protein